MDIHVPSRDEKGSEQPGIFRKLIRRDLRISHNHQGAFDSFAGREVFLDKPLIKAFFTEIAKCL